MTLNIRLAASAALLLAVLAAPVSAQTEEEPDCPEDYDTLPGCDMTPPSERGNSAEPEQSEPQPVAGAATAPTAKDGEMEQGDKVIASPEAGAPAPEDSAGTDENTQQAAASDSSGSGDKAASGNAETHEVMAQGVKFSPAILFIQPGDTVSWTNMASHNVVTLDSMTPEGVESINSELGANISRTFETEGIIVYKCAPHWGNRMGGVIIVGSPDNAGEIIDGYMQVTEEEPDTLPARGLLKDARAQLESQGM